LVNITLAAAKRGGRIKKDIKSFPGPPPPVINHSPGGTRSVLQRRKKERKKERERGGFRKREAPEYVVAVGCYFLPF
jgi:hypothetical protein